MYFFCVTFEVYANSGELSASKKKVNAAFC